MPGPEDNEGAFPYSSQAATCLPRTVQALYTVHIVPFIAEHQAGKL